MRLLSKSLVVMSFLTVGLSFSNQALAADSVVVPLYSPNLNSSKVGNITSLITSEVDFSGRYDMVSQATQRPKSLTPSCLKSVSCLRPIAQNEGVDAMITGSVTKVGGELEFFIILYERSKIIRMKRFKIKDDPLSVAADVGGYIQEVVTGQAPAVEEDVTEDVPLMDTLEEEGDIFGGEDLGDPLDFSLDPEEEARKEAEARAEEERRAEEARLAEEARRKQEMEEQARRLAMEAEAARLAAEANQAQEEDDFDFDFAPSTVEVVDTTPSDGIIEEDEITLNFDDPKPKKTKPEPKKSDYEPSTSYNSSRTKKPSKSRSPSSGGRIDAAATLAGKVGAGNFQTLNFVTYGGEVGIHMSESVSVQIAGEGFATYQATPVLDDNGDPTDVMQQSWRLLIPVSLGAVYHFEGKMAKPYIGADLQVLPAYAGVGSGLAVGVRGRVGSNFMVADNFGFNLNVGLGFWNGQYFTQVPSPAGGGLNPTGFTPQISVGPLVAF